MVINAVDGTQQQLFLQMRQLDEVCFGLVGLDARVFGDNLHDKVSVYTCTRRAA
jgi:hypothetical protein